MRSLDPKIDVITEWYHLYGDSVFKYICMMTRDYQQAQDLTQETFIKAYEKFDSFKHLNAKGWLYSIAHNVTIDFLRKRRPLSIFEKLLMNKEDSAPLPEEQLEMKEEIRELYRALANLKESYREVVILRKIKEFSVEETSYILNWSEAKVRTTMHRAMKQLEEELLKEGYVYDIS